MLGFNCERTCYILKNPSTQDDCNYTISFVGVRSLIANAKATAESADIEIVPAKAM